ncbi:type II toxin-antitoxin system RnlB family antitoxin [Desulfocurvibacter africanus]|uniref:type II toxin-antitoxin system RnlB family antitoxin n=1 Tax=Desulfocurvibacter africanus TaxID=873 RepID=UPI0003F4E646|nr:type II toxin-antitoxin system RnlB family antitoxin [Desulfocurvibacter africanus]
MKLYEMKKIPNPDCGFLIFSLSHINPLDQLQEVENELSRVSYIGLVVFDLLMTVGNTSNRFMQMLFDGRKLVLQSAKRVEDACEDLQSISADFYRNNFDSLDTTVLTKPARYKLRKGLAV